MRLFEDSVLLLLIKWMTKLPWMKGQEMRSQHHYEHTYTGVVLSAFISCLPIGLWKFVLWGIVFLVHVFLKEIVDELGGKKQPRSQTYVDLTTRTYGMLLGFLIIILT